MCGIAGILRVWPSEQRELALSTPSWGAIPERWLDVLDESITHRGPDGHGRFRDRVLRADGCVVDVAFVHRRLSIIDHAGGHQPMLSLAKGMGVVTGTKRVVLGEGLGLYERDAKSELFGAHVHGAMSSDLPHPQGGLQGGKASVHSDTSGSPTPSSSPSPSSDRVCVIFNGCIYNHRELRAELQNAGHVFSTDHSDTEVLVHGWREWSWDMFNRLDGMFSLIVWDLVREAFVIARAGFGEKPLHAFHVCRTGSWVNVYSSVPPAATVLPTMIGESSQVVLPFSPVADWIRLGWGMAAPLPGSGVIRPGAYVSYQARSPDEERLKATDCPPPTERCFHGPSRRRVPRESALDSTRVDKLLEAAVATCIDADVPLGCFLSGGVDSSLVAMYAKRHASKLKTFSMRMPVGVYDESHFASEVASILGTQHATLDCEPSPASDLELIIKQIGLPFGDSSILPSLWLSRAARQHVAVAIGGDGGDELFAGYQRFRAAPWLANSIPGADILGRWLRSWGEPRTPLGKAARFFDSLGNLGYLDLISIFPSSDLQQLYPEMDMAGFHLYNANAQIGVRTMEDAMLLDILNYLPFDILCKTDSASMAAALELRSPFLTANVSHAAITAPISDLMPHGQRKGLLRQVARKYFPSEIVDRPKMGFAIPIGEWFRSDYGGLRTMLLDHLNSTEPFGPPSLGIDLNMAFVRQMLDEHLGTGPSGLIKRDHSQRLYMLLVLSIWAKWLGGLSGKMEGPRG